MIKRSLIAVVIISAVFSGCYFDKKEKLYPSVGPCDTTNITYDNYVGQVMKNSCALSGCHDATKQGGYQLDNYAQVKAAALDMAKGAPGKLLGTISHASGFFPMPDGRPKLDDCTIKKITAWVNSGTPQ